MWFKFQKDEKNLKSRNVLKSPLRALNKELWAIYVFSSNLKVHDFQKHQRKQPKIKTLWRIEFQPQNRSKVMSNLSLKMWNFKADFRGGNQLKIMMVTKDLSSRRKLRKVFKKIFFEKMRFYVQKYEKNWKSKNDVKTALTPLFKELWAIYVFFTNFKIDDFQNYQRKQTKI